MSVEPEAEQFRQAEINTGDRFPRPVPKPVFYDPTGRRARFVTISLFLWLAFLLAWLGDFTTRVSTLPPLPGVSLAEGPVGEAPAPAVVTAINPESAVRCRPQPFVAAPEGGLVSGFVPYGDAAALSSLNANCARLQDIFHEAFGIDPDSGAVTELSPVSMTDPVAAARDIWSRGGSPFPHAVIRPAPWIAPARMAEILAGPGDFGESIAAIALDPDSAGLCLDLTSFPGLPGAAVGRAARLIEARSGAAGLDSCLIAPIGATYLADRPVIDAVDRVVVQISAFGSPAAATPVPLAAQEAWLAEVAALVPAAKLQLAVDTRGVLLRSDERDRRPVSFAEAMYLAERHGASFGYSPQSGTMTLRFVDDARILNQIWLPHAGTLDALARGIDTALPPVIWPLGYEDPALWSQMGAQDDAPARSLSGAVDLGGFAVLDGAGPFSALLDAARPGLREVEVDAGSGVVTGSTFTELPRPHHLRAFGLDPSPNGLSLAFTGLQGGGDIPALLEMLEARGIRAIFFVSARDLFSARDAVGRIVAAGHHLGVALAPSGSGGVATAAWAGFRNDLVQHYLTHNHGARARFVLDAQTWRSSPDTSLRLRQMIALDRSGYLMVQPNLTIRPDPVQEDAILEAVFDQAIERPTNVLNVDLRQADDGALIAFLPAMLDRLGAEGFDILPLEAIAGVTAGEVNPAIVTAPAARDDVTYWMLTASWAGIQGVIFLLALIVALRSPIYLCLAWVRRRRYRLDPDYHPPMTLIIPAFNEEKVIFRTVESALALDYPDLRIFVVDDGSTDRTRDIVRAHYEGNPRVRLIVQANGGKWAALDHAISEVQTEFMAILDADSLVDPMALRHIVQPFKNPRVGGVAGTVEIGNRGNLLTAFQTLEYMHTQQVMRRAYEVFDGIIVVPGAMGAWRVQAVRDSGLVSGDTITEDADLTIAVHRAGYRIRYQEEARSYTEAPTTVRAFMRQRLRWTFGMFQVSWKHKRSVLEGRPVGFISIVDAIWYQLITSIIYPFIDLYMLITIGRVAHALLTPASLSDIQIPVQLSLAYMVIVFFDFANILTAMIMARRFEWKFFLIAPLSRIGYRQMLYIASIRAVFSAIVGRIAQWNKLERAGTAQLGN